MTGIVAVHCGAGKHNVKNHYQFNRLSKQACKKGVEILKNGGSALEAVTAAVVALENDPLTNAGYGSNLTIDGSVENDASVMDGKTLLFGGCGAVKNVKNPVRLAYDICVKQKQSQPLGLVPPSLLVGRGGVKHAKCIGLKIVRDKHLITHRAQKQHKKYTMLLESSADDSDSLLDTVGAVCIDDTGNVAAASSSGGLLLKRSGRVGQAALYGSGVWADSLDVDSESSVAVCTTGCGEYLVRTQLAKEVAIDVKNDNTCATTTVYKSITNKFLNSRYLRDVDQKLGGALVLRSNQSKNEVEVLWGHSTETMSLGYMKTSDLKPKAMVSQLPEDVQMGAHVNVGGMYFYTKEDT